MRKLLAALMALVLMCGCAGAQAARYGWAFVIYDLGLSIEIDDSYQRTDDEALEDVNSFEQSGNVKARLILELYNPETYAQMFVYCAEGSPYDNLDELTGAYAEDLGASTDQPGADGTEWQILPEGKFQGLECTRILSSFQNVSAEYVLMLSADHSAYIIALITFDGAPPDSQLEGITFGGFTPADDAGEGMEIASESDAGAQSAADGAEEAEPTAGSERAGRSGDMGLIGGLLGG